MGGDFNCIDSPSDKVSQKLDKSSSMLTQFKTDLKLIDIWRFVNPDKKEYSFIDPTGQGKDSRIDLWLISKPNTKFITSCKIIQPRCKGYWKMNNSVIYDEKYKKGITKLYNDALGEYEHVSLVLLWEIKEFTILYCISKCQSTKNHIKDLEEKLDAIDRSHKKDENRIERKILKQQLDNLYEQKAIGYQIRSRARWVEQGEKSSAYFLSLEKARQASNTINSLKDADGESHDSDHAVLNIAKSFYEKLYTAKPSSDTILDAYSSSLPRERVLGNDSQLKCEGLVSYPECIQSLNKIKKNKSPGLDGITTEFYQEFWPLIGNLLVDVYNQSHDTESLPNSLRKSVMSLIYKKDDEDDIRNYRPISLTNVDSCLYIS